jgi:WD repeat-containing protein 19
MKAYQKVGNVSMVYSLNQMKYIEEKKILQGFVAMILCDYTLSQELFQKSSNRKLALELRCDIQDWGTALTLSETLSVDRVPMIRRKLAEQQERQGNNQQALKLFEKSQIDNTSATAAEKRKHAKHNMLCLAGIARTSIKTGNVSRGYAIATEIQDKEMCVEIASACEQMKQIDEAATLYEKGHNYEKAAQLYITLKEFRKAEALMKHITKTSILISLAKMKETEGDFKEAEYAYERANEWENVIRLNLERLNNYTKAFQLFTDKSPTQGCASLLAEYCERQDMKKEAIGFLVRAGKKTDAFNKAQIYQEMESYAENLEEINAQESLKIAQYYEGKDDYKRAGKYYETSGQYNNS